jgi:hypothetical protein
MKTLEVGQTVFTFPKTASGFICNEWKIADFNPQKNLVLCENKICKRWFQSALIVPLENCELYSTKEELKKLNSNFEVRNLSFA